MNYTFTFILTELGSDEIRDFLKGLIVIAACVVVVGAYLWLR